MSIFSEKSGKSRNLEQPRGLTAGLPDVPTSEALHRNLIRALVRAVWSGNSLKDAFKAPSLRYQSKYWSLA
jgi:hypothetical protein